MVRKRRADSSACRVCRAHRSEACRVGCAHPGIRPGHSALPTPSSALHEHTERAMGERRARAFGVRWQSEAATPLWLLRGESNGSQRRTAPPSGRTVVLCDPQPSAVLLRILRRPKGLGPAAKPIDLRELAADAAPQAGDTAQLCRQSADAKTSISTASHRSTPASRYAADTAVRRGPRGVSTWGRRRGGPAGTCRRRATRPAWPRPARRARGRTAR